MRLALAAVLLMACGSKTPPPPPPDPVAHAAPDAGAQAPAACPATWADAKGACDPKVSDHYCSYPDGECWCGIEVPCSGMRRPDEWYDEQPNVWQCTATPPAVRPDGCPGAAPTGACTTEGQSCSYGDCCYQRYLCEKGQWVLGDGGCPA